MGNISVHSKTQTANLLYIGVFFTLFNSVKVMGNTQNRLFFIRKAKNDFLIIAN